MSREAATHDIYHSDGSAGSLHVQGIFICSYMIEVKPEISALHAQSFSESSLSLSEQKQHRLMKQTEMQYVVRYFTKVLEIILGGKKAISVLQPCRSKNFM